MICFSQNNRKSPPLAPRVGKGLKLFSLCILCALMGFFCAAKATLAAISMETGSDSMIMQRGGQPASGTPAGSLPPGYAPQPGQVEGYGAPQPGQPQAYGPPLPGQPQAYGAPEGAPGAQQAPDQSPFTTDSQGDSVMNTPPRELHSPPGTLEKLPYDIVPEIYIPWIAPNGMGQGGYPGGYPGGYQGGHQGGYPQQQLGSGPVITGPPQLQPPRQNPYTIMGPGPQMPQQGQLPPGGMPDNLPNMGKPPKTSPGGSGRPGAYRGDRNNGGKWGKGENWGYGSNWDKRGPSGASLHPGPNYGPVVVPHGNTAVVLPGGNGTVFMPNAPYMIPPTAGYATPAIRQPLTGGNGPYILPPSVGRTTPIFIPPTTGYATPAMVRPQSPSYPGRGKGPRPVRLP